VLNCIRWSELINGRKKRNHLQRLQGKIKKRKKGEIGMINIDFSKTIGLEEHEV